MQTFSLTSYVRDFVVAPVAHMEAQPVARIADYLLNRVAKERKAIIIAAVARIQRAKIWITQVWMGGNGYKPCRSIARNMFNAEYQPMLSATEQELNTIAPNCFSLLWNATPGDIQSL